MVKLVAIVFLIVALLALEMISETRRWGRGSSKKEKEGAEEAESFER